uniref:Uncharacterized protein n=1 Tax=Arion vulgaris TaxID=1028688 RepID=A0A0B7BSM9_9EUPU
MGNLCSSGTERTDKKEENRVPDKPRDGEDEALLPTSGNELGVGPDGGQVAVEAEAGGDGTGDGIDGILSGAVQSGESAFTAAARAAEVECKTVTATELRSSSEVKDHIVEGLQTSATAAVTNTAANVISSAEEAVTHARDDVEKEATETYQNVSEKVEEAVGDIKNKFSVGSLDSNVANVRESSPGEVQTLGSEAESWRGNAQDAANEANSVVDSFKPRGESLISEAATNVVLEDIPVSAVSAGLKSAADVAEEDKTTPSALAAEDSLFGNVKAQLGNKAADVNETAEAVAENIKQTAENKVNEAVESARLSASEAFSSWAETSPQKEAADDVNSAEPVGNVQETVQDTEQRFSQPGLDALENVGEYPGSKLDASEISTNTPTTYSDIQLTDVESQGFENFFESVQESAADSLTTAQDVLEQSASQQYQNIEQSHNDEDRSEQHSEDVKVSFQNEAAAVNDITQAWNSEALNSSSTVTEITAVEETGSGVRDLQDVFSDPVQLPSGFEDVVEATRESADTSELYDTISQDQFAEKYVQDEVNEKIIDAADSFPTEWLPKPDALSDEANQDPAQVSWSDAEFVETSKSVLENQGHSLEETKASVPSVTITDQDVEDSAAHSEQTADSENASHEATAREFVESIIEKATSLVSESQEQKEPSSDSSSPSDPCVDRGEETLAPKKRGVMFVSPQISDVSSSSLSSPQEISPPPPHELDLSPPADSSSSISQCELVESDELLIPPPLPADYAVSENNNNNNNILNNNTEDDDESIQRVAMEVTAKAVQDAIKIVAENGTSIVVNTNNGTNNDLGSPSSPDNDEEEMTTTDSSQVERGSPVSDLTDTSAHGSVSESLSSYDPGAVFRQDIVNFTDFSSSHADTAVQPGNQRSPQVNKPHDKTADLINFEDESTSHAETPTPTNSTSFDTYPHQPTQTPNDDLQRSDIHPPPPFSSEVPSSLPSIDDLSTSPNKPTIIINSPDSAHHTNGSTEDVSSSQTEALI